MSKKNKKGYYQYIDDVNSGTIATCLYVKLLVRRFEEFCARDDIYFDEEYVDNIIEFVAQMKHWVGKSANRPFILLPWQQFLVAILGLKYKDSNLRVCRDLYLQLARKQGKSSIIAAIVLAMLIVDGEAAPSIPVLATSRDQARILFGMVTDYAKSIDPKGTMLKYYKNYIQCPTNHGEVKVYSSEAGRLDGLSASVGIIDEYAALPDNSLYTVIKSSMAFREQPLMICLTTPQFSLTSPAYKTYQTAIEVLNGVKQDDAFWPIIYTLDPNDEWDDENVWIKSNPSLGETVTKEYIKGEVTKAKNDSTYITPCKIRTIGVWCSAETEWIPAEIVAKSMKEVDLEDFRGSMGVLGMDLGAVSDFSSISLLIERDAVKYFKTWTFIPEETYKTHPNKLLYERFVQEGSMIITPGNCTDYNYVMNKIREINDIVQIKTIYTDSWNATSTMITLSDMGFMVEPYSQAIGNFNGPTKSMERHIRDGLCVIDKSQNVLWQFSHVTLRVDVNGNCKPDKSKVNNKIDSVISMCTALGGYERTPFIDDMSILVF